MGRAAAVECVRVPGVPVVRIAASGGGGGGGQHVRAARRRPAATAIIDVDAIASRAASAARTTAGSKGLSEVAGQSCLAGAGSSALHPPHDLASASSGPRVHSHSA